MPNLNSKQIKSLPPGRHGDGRGGHGLILLVSSPTSRSWIWRGTVASNQRGSNGKRSRGKVVERGLGSVEYVSLSEARQRAFEYRQAARKGIDPITLDTATKPQTPTLSEMCGLVIERRTPAWKEASRQKRITEWSNAFAKHLYPTLGDKPISEVTTLDLVAVFAPIWHSDAGDKLRSKTVAVFDAAIGEGHISANQAGAPLTAALGKPKIARQRMRSLSAGDLAAALHDIEASECSPRVACPTP